MEHNPSLSTKTLKLINFESVKRIVDARPWLISLLPNVFLGSDRIMADSFLNTFQETGDHMGKTKNFAKFKFLSILIDKLLAFLALTQFLELRRPIVMSNTNKEG